MADPLVMSATELARGGLRRALQQVEATGAVITITSYRRPVALLGPAPARIASDPNEVLAERIENTAGNSTETPLQPRVTPRTPR